MNMFAILAAVLALGGLGALFGVLLTVADKKFYVPVDERIEKVQGCLGGANCGACGYAGCAALADAIVAGKAKPNACPPAGAEGAAKIAEIMGLEAGDDKPMVARVLCQGASGIAKDRYIYDGLPSCRAASTMAGGPKMCTFACLGLGDCQKVCAFDAISIKDALVQINENKCTACGMCAQTCPRGVIQLLPRDQSVIVRCRNSDTGRMAREACVKACIGCKRCEKECQYDAIHVENGFARIDPDKCTRCGACAKVCPCGCITMPEA